MTDFTGQNIGRYHIVEKLGQGGMATVYRAFDTRLEREVAVKVIRRGAFGEEQLASILRRFEREARAVARLDHPNIVRVYDYGEHEGAPYLVMQYLPGGSLKARTGAPMPYRQAIRLILPIAQALAYAHQNEIVHRDVKPANILITQNGTPVLSDFGIAKIIESEESTQLTSTGVGIGTPEYMAPEQWEGKTSPQTDIYALGVVLYELITGRKPYTAETPAAIYRLTLTEPLPRPKSYIPDLPDEVERVLFKALAKNPDDRYASMEALIKALEGVSSLSAPSHPMGETLTSTTSRKPQPNAATWQDRPVTGHAAPAGMTYAPPESAKSRARYLWWVFGGVVAALVALALIANAVIIGINLLNKGKTPTQAAAAVETESKPTRTLRPSATPQPPTRTPPPTDAPPEPVTLEIWTIASGDEYTYLQSLAEQFSAQNPNITVTFNRNDQDFFVTVDTLFASGAPPDMFLAYPEVMGKYARNGSLMPLDDWIDLSPYSPKMIELGALNGRIWGVPVWSSAQFVLFYNKSILQMPPQTTDEMIEDAKRLGLSYYHRGSFFMLFWLGGFGGNMQELNTNIPRLNTGEMIQTLSFLEDLIYTHQLLPPNAAYQSEMEKFTSGQTGMLISGTWEYPNLKNALGDNLGIARLPTVSATGKYPAAYIFGTQFYIVNKALDENKRRAIEAFIRFATNRENQLAMAEQFYYLPALTEAYNDPLLLNQPLLFAMLQQLPGGSTPARLETNFVCILQVTDTYYQQFIDRSLTAEAAAEQMQIQVESCIQNNP